MSQVSAADARPGSPASQTFHTFDFISLGVSSFLFVCFLLLFFKNYLPSHTAAFFYPPVILWSGMLYVLQHVYGGQRTALELVLSFYHASPKQGTQVLGLGSKNPYLQSHLAGPSTSGFCCIFKVLALSKPHPEND